MGIWTVICFTAAVLKKLKNLENSFVLTTEDDSLSEIHNGRQSHESFHSRLVNHCWSSSNGTSSCSSVWNRRTICHCTLFCCLKKESYRCCRKRPQGIWRHLEERQQAL